MKSSEFLKKVGIGSAVLAFLLIVANTLATPAWAGERISFHFMALSDAATVERVQHRTVMAGSGTFNEDEVTGGGSFLHFNAASPIPSTILGTGTWRAKEIVSFKLVGKYGALAAGILEMLVDLIPDDGPPIEDASLKVVCNIGFAGLLTGEPEGFTLDIPDAPFGAFNPLDPGLGLTVFGTRDEER